MFPPDHRWANAATSLFPTRGDVSSWKVHVTATDPFFPHTRGCFLVDILVQRVSAVFSLHTGMFRWARSSTMTHHLFPIYGDVSIAATIASCARPPFPTYGDVSCAPMPTTVGPSSFLTYRDGSPVRSGDSVVIRSFPYIAPGSRSFPTYGDVSPLSPRYGEQWPLQHLWVSYPHQSVSQWPSSHRTPHRERSLGIRIPGKKHCNPL